MRKIYEDLTLGIAVLFMALMFLQSCSPVQREQTAEDLKKRVGCVIECGLEDIPITKEDAEKAASKCFKQCLSE